MQFRLRPEQEQEQEHKQTTNNNKFGQKTTKTNMKIMNKIVAAGAVIGAVGVAHADFVTFGGGYVDEQGSSLQWPYNYLTQSTPYSGTSTLQFTANQVANANPSDLVVQLTGISEYPGTAGNPGNSLGNPPTPAGAHFVVNSFTVTGPVGSLTGGVSSGGPIAPQFQASLSQATTYTVAVNWTFVSGFTTGENNFDINFAVDLNGQSQSSSLNMDSYVAVTPSTSVPEPSQAIAGITLLGCGGLVFLGRRFVMKKA